MSESISYDAIVNRTISGITLQPALFITYTAPKITMQPSLFITYALQGEFTIHGDVIRDKKAKFELHADVIRVRTINHDIYIDAGDAFNKNREIDLLKFVPDVLRHLNEIETLMGAQDEAVKAMWEEVENTFRNQFIRTSDENGIKLFEKMHGIIGGSTDLETRRWNLFLLYNQDVAFTRPYLENYLLQYFGEGNYTLTYDTENFTVWITFPSTLTDRIKNFLSWMESIIPYNMLFGWTSQAEVDSTLFVAGHIRRTYHYVIDTGTIWDGLSSTDEDRELTIDCGNSDMTSNATYDLGWSGSADKNIYDGGDSLAAGNILYDGGGADMTPTDFVDGGDSVA